MDSKDLKIRCSSLGTIMTGEVGLSVAKNERLNILLKRHLTEGEKPLTEKMVLEMEALQFIAENPELSKTPKSHIEERFNEIEFGISEYWTNRYVEKGIGQEDESLMLAQRINNWEFLSKNEERITNDFISGIPDAIATDFIVEIKTSWSMKTFPLYVDENPTKNYEWQVQGYMWLTGKTVAQLSYCLVDTPDELVNDDLFKTSRKMGCIDLPAEIEAEIRANHCFEHVPENLRVKTFEVKRNEEMIEAIKERIGLCREYYNELKSKIEEV
jgi:hypothetical protein